MEWVVLNPPVWLASSSYGYIGEEGKKMYDRGKAVDYGSAFVVGDVIGCGLHFGTQDVFFTHNGKFLGVAFARVSFQPYFPTISLHTSGERVSVNFGTGPFRFNLEAFVDEEKRKTIQAVQVTPFEVTSVTTLIQEYLLHCGFDQTYQAFARNLPSEASPWDQQYTTTLAFRKSTL